MGGGGSARDGSAWGGRGSVGRGGEVSRQGIEEGGGGSGQLH